MEAEAFLWAVQLASQMHFKKVIIDGEKKRKLKNRARILSPSLLKAPQFLYLNPKYLRFYIIKEIAMSKRGYGLNLRLPSQQKTKQQQQKSTKLPRPPALGFINDDEDDVESDISWQASEKQVSQGQLRNSRRKPSKKTPLFLIMTEFMMTQN